MKYKLVPIEPTQEMIDEGRTARTHPKERYKAMLAAAPDVEQEPVAWIISHPRFCGKFTDDKKIAEYWESEEQGCTAPLFLHQQPEPEVAELVEVLDEMIDVAKRVDSWESFPSDPIEKAEEALSDYRNQGGEL